MVSEPSRVPGFESPLGPDATHAIYAELLRDGRVAIGTRARAADGSWKPGELQILDPPVYLDLVAWLAPVVEVAWLDTVRQRQADPLRTARDLYGDGPGAVERLAHDMLREIPPSLLARGLILLANSVGPEARARLIAELNQTLNRAEDSELRRRLAHEHETFAYAVAAAALFDALERGITAEDLDE